MKTLTVVIHQLFQFFVTCKIHVLIYIDPVNDCTLFRYDLVAAFPLLARLHNALVPKQCTSSLDEYSVDNLNHTAGLGHIYREGPKDVLLTVVEHDPRGDLYLSRHEYEKAVTEFTRLSYYVVLL